MLELYHAGRTTCSRKARLCLAEKGLDYVSHYMNLGAFENHTPEYLKLNPNGVVPTLVHDGTVIIESTFINEYIDEVFPEPPLRPADPALTAKMRVWGKIADAYGLAAGRVPPRAETEKANHDSRPAAGAVEEGIARVPPPENAAEDRPSTGDGFSEADFENSYATMDMIYAKTEAALADGPWLVGEQYTLADINMLPFITQFGAYRPELLDGKSHPRTKEWHERCMARPAVIKTYTPSDEAPDFPPQSKPAA